MALRLQPNLAEAHLALGQCAYWMDEDYERALAEFGDRGDIVPERRGNRAFDRVDKTPAGKMAGVSPRIRKSSEDRSAKSKYRSRTCLYQHGAAALAGSGTLGKQMRAMAPASLVAKIQSGYVDFWWKGDTRLLKSLLSQVPAGTDPDGVITSCRWDVAMIDRDFAAARKALQTSDLNEIAYTNAAATPKSFLQGLYRAGRRQTGGRPEIV